MGGMCHRRPAALALMLAAAVGCDDGMNDIAGDGRPERGVIDASADVLAIDASADGSGLDMTWSDMASRDMAWLDMASSDMSFQDIASLDMASRDMTTPDQAPPDTDPPCDAAPRDIYLPDFGIVELCANGQDDDDDTLIDCGDPDCRGSGACFHVREDCGNGIDDDGDRHIDCADGYCLVDPRCPPPEVEPYTPAELQRRFDAECTFCHGAIDPFSGLDLNAPFEATTVDVPSAQVRGMARIKPGDRQQSFLYLKLTWHHLEVGGDGEGMPPLGEKWSAADAERLGRWIDGLGTN